MWRTRRVPSKAAKAEAAKTAEFFATGRDCADKGRSRRLTQVLQMEQSLPAISSGASKEEI
jgi:hypothetical protein